jgi:drug/metabolite transporter (DMT)-like permease
MDAAPRAGDGDVDGAGQATVKAAPVSARDGSRAVAIAVVANLIGGTSYVLTKLALDGLTETTVVVVRTVVALACLAPAARGRQASVLRARGADRRSLLAMAIVGYALPLVLGSYGLRRSTATNAALLIGTEPLGVVLLSALVLGEALTRARVVALALGLVGATVLVTNGIPFVTVAYAMHPVGDVLLVVHGVAWSVYTVAAKRLVGRYDPFALSAAVLLIALPFLVPPALIEAQDFPWDATRLVPALAAAVTLGVLVSAGMTVLWNYALQYLEASRMAALIFLQPLFGMVLGIVVLQEPATPYAVVGGALIVLGVLLVAREERATIARYRRSEM